MVSERNKLHHRLAWAAFDVIRAAGPDTSWGAIQDAVANAIADELFRQARSPTGLPQLADLIRDHGGADVVTIEREHLRTLASAGPGFAIIQQFAPALAQGGLNRAGATVDGKPIDLSNSDHDRKLAEAIRAAKRATG